MDDELLKQCKNYYHSYLYICIHTYTYVVSSKFISSRDGNANASEFINKVKYSMMFLGKQSSRDSFLSSKSIHFPKFPRVYSY